MNSNQKSVLAAMVFGLGLVSASWGHLDSLKINGELIVAKTGQTTWSIPKGGQTFTAGQTVTVTYLITISHPAVNYMKYSSNNGGAYTISMQKTLSGTVGGMQTFLWVVPSMASTQGKLKVYQAFSTNPEKNTSDDYNLVSGVFTIQTVSPIFQFSHEKKLAVHQTSGALWLNLQVSGVAGKAEICGLNGSVMRSLFIPGNSQHQSVMSTTGLPTGKAIVRLFTEGQPSQNQMVFIRP